MTDPSRPLVTIGICTYNRADSYLGSALQSAVDQTYPNLEIVVSDNCSVDHTEELVQSFDDPRIRYIKHEKEHRAERTTSTSRPSRHEGHTSSSCMTTT
jgi:glycosyltransferase involved in cell wall biosynthesis